MKRNILFNSKTYEAEFNALAKKEVPYYIRKFLEKGKESYIQTKKNGSCNCYILEDGVFYYYKIENLDDKITNYYLIESENILPNIRRKLLENGCCFRKNKGFLFKYKLVNNLIYIVEIEVESRTYGEVYKIMNSKDIRSRASGKEVTFVRRLVDEHFMIKDEVFCDIVNLVDNKADVYDDISYMYSNLKDGNVCNMEDFYYMYGAYEEGSAFINNVKNLIRDRDVA